MLSHSKEISLTIVIKCKAKDNLKYYHRTTVNWRKLYSKLQGLQSAFYTARPCRALLLIWTVISHGPCTPSYYIGLVKLQKQASKQTLPKQKPTETTKKKPQHNHQQSPHHISEDVKIVLQFLRQAYSWRTSRDLNSDWNYLPY